MGLEPSAVAVPLPGEQKPAKVQVGQQGRGYPALRRPPVPVARVGAAPFAARCALDGRHPQPRLDDGQHGAVRHPSGHAAHQRAVRDLPEAVAQIGIDPFAAPGARDVPVGPADGHLGVAVRAEPVLIAREIRLEDRLQHYDHRRLHHPVADRGDAERALAAGALGDPYPQQGLGPVGRGRQLLPQPFQPNRNPLGLDRREALAVHARRPAVRAAAPVRLGEHIRTAHLVPQGVKAEGWFSLGFRLQRGLQRPNPIVQRW